jgi:hypothetical protein
MKTNYQFQNISAGTQSQAYVDQSAMLTATTGTPSVGQFRSTILGRASIPNITADVRASFGVERIMIQQGYLIQNEFGPSGEPVWGAVNDTNGLIRCVGGGFYNGLNAYGAGISTANVNEYIEIVFYGTGLNWISMQVNDIRDASVTVDGVVTRASGVKTAANHLVLGNRGYAPNNTIWLVTGLTLGLHTVKLTNISDGYNFGANGFEILNESASGLINVNTGSAYYRGNKITNSVADSIAYNTGVTGTKGGRIVRYFTGTDSQTQAFTACASSPSYLTSASHTSEEVVRTFNWREFGCGRTDDFSLATGINIGARAFTLDDATTTLLHNNVYVVASTDTLGFGVDGAYTTFTFVGCGLDILRIDNAGGGTDTYNVYVDGSLVGNLANVGKTYLRVEKIASGLPYGTHVVTIVRNAATTYTPGIRAFIVYQPKKPSLPTGAIEVCDYNVMADFVANTVAQVVYLSPGVLRKHGTREFVYVDGTGGTTNWLATINASFIGGYRVDTDRTGAYCEYTFFGRGFDFRFRAGTAESSNITVSLQSLSTGGSLLTATTANFPTLASSVYGTGVGFSSGILDQLDGTNTTGCGLVITGLTLGLWKVRFTNNTAGSYIDLDAIDVITPIHTYDSNVYATLQNTLTVGNNSLMDSRQTSPNPSSLTTPKALVQAVGVTSNPTTTSTSFVPCPDMSVTIKTTGGSLYISYAIDFYCSAAGATGAAFQIYLDGVAVGTPKTLNSYVSGANMFAADIICCPCSSGYHKVDVYFSAVSTVTVTAYTTQRTLIVREL